MSDYVVTAAEDLDAILAEHYGVANVSTALRDVLEANPGLAAIAGEPLPPGTKLALPDDAGVAPATAGGVVELWTSTS